MKNTGKIIVILMLMTSAALFTIADAARADETKRFRLGDILARQPSEREKKVLTAALKAIAAGSGGESESIRKSLENAICISAPGVAVRALMNNLYIAVGLENSAAARAAVMEAKAVFDPVFTVTVGYAETDTYQRSKDVKLYTTNFFPGAPIQFPVDPNNDDPQIVELGWRNQTYGEESIQEISASEDQENGPARSLDRTISVFQQLPWGPQVQIISGLLNQPVYYDKYGHSYDAPWSGSKIFDVQAPLPFTKGFGPDASSDIDLKISKTQDEAGFWAAKKVIDDILLRVEVLFLNLAKQLELLYLAVERENILARRMETIKRNWENREATNFDRLQMETALAGAGLVRENAAGSFLQSSYALAEMIEAAPRRSGAALYLPYGYSERASDASPIDAHEALMEALTKRPELREVKAELDRARLFLNYAENQTMPDLKISARIALSQDGSVFGYETPLDSILNMNNPDQVSQIYSLAFSRSPGNRAAKARKRQAEIEAEDVLLARRGMFNQIVREINQASTALAAETAKAEEARRTLALTQKAYDKIVQRREYDDAPEFEYLINLQKLMIAKTLYMSAKIDRRTARARFSAARGAMAEEFLERHAGPPAEQRRIEMLKKLGLLVFFEPAFDALADEKNGPP